MLNPEGAAGMKKKQEKSQHCNSIFTNAVQPYNLKYELHQLLT